MNDYHTMSHKKPFPADDKERREMVVNVRKYLHKEWNFQTMIELGALLGVHPERLVKDKKTGDILVHCIVDGCDKIYRIGVPKSDQNE